MWGEGGSKLLLRSWGSHQHLGAQTKAVERTQGGDFQSLRLNTGFPWETGVVTRRRRVVKQCWQAGEERRCLGTPREARVCPHTTPVPEKGSGQPGCGADVLVHKSPLTSGSSWGIVFSYRRLQSSVYLGFVTSCGCVQTLSPSPASTFASGVALGKSLRLRASVTFCVKLQNNRVYFSVIH